MSCERSIFILFQTESVSRKILVLDLDETLIHSHHDGLVRPNVKPGTPPDFVLRVSDYMQIMDPQIKKKSRSRFFLRMPKKRSK